MWLNSLLLFESIPISYFFFPSDASRCMVSVDERMFHLRLKERQVKPGRGLPSTWTWASQYGCLLSRSIFQVSPFSIDIKQEAINSCILFNRIHVVDDQPVANIVCMYRLLSVRSLHHTTNTTSNSLQFIQILVIAWYWRISSNIERVTCFHMKLIKVMKKGKRSNTESYFL